MKQSLINTEGLSKEDILEKIASGGRFIVFQYTLSLGLVSFYRLTRPILVCSNQEFVKYRNKYNLMSWLFGLWFIPTGPYRVVKSLKINNRGGIDTTKDIEVNIETYDVSSCEIELVQMDTIFGHLPDSELKEVRKALSAYLEQNETVISSYAALFINVEEYVEPPYIIGVERKFEKSLDEEIRSHFYKRFRKFVQLEIWYKDMDNEAYEKLERQGHKLVGKNFTQ